MARRELNLVLILHVVFSVQEDCFTTQQPPQKCVFPFIYQDFSYNGCTNVTDDEGRQWCATKVDEEGKYIAYSGHFGHCQPSCRHQDNNGEFALRAISEKDRCANTEQCIDQNQCQDFQDRKEELSTLRRDNPQYSEILRELQTKICNRESQKVCCSCPCLSKDQCPHILALYETRDFSRLKALICNKKERTFFCCNKGEEQGEKVEQQDTHQIIPDDPKTNPSWLPDPADYQDCGFNISPPSRVKGGYITQMGEYPFTALIGSTDSKGKVGWKCGGTLINHWYVLTAAHCEGSSSFNRISKVRLGEWSVKSKEDCWRNPDRGTSWCLELPQDFDISRSQVTKHHNFRPSGNFENDIALVKLDRPAELGRGVSIVCLPVDLGLAARQLNVRNLQGGLEGNYGVVVGWGYTDYDPFKEGSQGDISEFGVAQNFQQKLEIPVMSAEQCNDKFRGRFTPADTQICAGGELGKDSCKTIVPNGVRPSDDNLEPVYLLGIVSFGSKFCGNGSPGVYTSVRHFMPWIKQIIRR